MFQVVSESNSMLGVSYASTCKIHYENSKQLFLFIVAKLEKIVKEKSVSSDIRNLWLECMFKSKTSLSQS